jgi:hypothetical protein
MRTPRRPPGAWRTPFAVVIERIIRTRTPGSPADTRETTRYWSLHWLMVRSGSGRSAAAKAARIPASMVSGMGDVPSDGFDGMRQRLQVLREFSPQRHVNSFGV